MIELITVMIVIGILAAVAVARLDVSGYRERAFHDGFKAALQYARKAAIAKRRHVCVDVTTGSGTVLSFTVMANTPEAAAVACPAATALNLPGGSTNTLSTPSGVSLDAGADFSFDALGRASASGTFSSTGEPDISVEQETGYVH